MGHDKHHDDRKRGIAEGRIEEKFKASSPIDVRE